MLHFSSICSFFFSVDICFLRIFLRESMSRIVNLWITHELIFYHLHSFHNRLSISFTQSDDIDVIRAKIELLFSSFGFAAEFFLILFLFQFFNVVIMLILFSLFVGKLLFSFFKLSSRHLWIIKFFGFFLIFLELLSDLFIRQQCLDNSFSLFVSCLQLILSVCQNLHGTFWSTSLKEHWVLVPLDFENYLLCFSTVFGRMFDLFLEFSANRQHVLWCSHSIILVRFVLRSIIPT